MADSTQVNVRYSNVLLARIDTAAGEGKRSKWILEACRMRLDGEIDFEAPAEWKAISERNRGKPITELEPYPANANTGSFVGIEREAPIGKPDLEALVSGIMERGPNSPPYSLSALAPANQSVPCGKTWWEDGEQYECLMTKGHKAIKCGQAGMVRNITP